MSNNTTPKKKVKSLQESDSEDEKVDFKISGFNLNYLGSKPKANQTQSTSNVVLPKKEVKQDREEKNKLGRFTHKITNSFFSKWATPWKKSNTRRNQKTQTREATTQGPNESPGNQNNDFFAIIKRKARKIRSQGRSVKKKRKQLTSRFQDFGNLDELIKNQIHQHLRKMFNRPDNNETEYTHQGALYPPRHNPARKRNYSKGSKYSSK